MLPDFRSFYRLQQFHFLECHHLFDPEKASNYTKQLKRPRQKYTDEFRTPMDCNSIKARGYFPDKSQTENEEKFPLAFARIVYKVQVFFCWLQISSGGICFGAIPFLLSLGSVDPQLISDRILGILLY